jgi:hypothetical protein
MYGLLGGVWIQNKLLGGVGLDRLACWDGSWCIRASVREVEDRDCWVVSMFSTPVLFGKTSPYR